VVVNYGTFEQMYEQVVEPWLGKYDQLKTTYSSRSQTWEASPSLSP
jgi:hypothetical protein